MDGYLTFHNKRVIYKEFKELEKTLKMKYREITVYTHLDRPHIMRMITKLGYKPFHLSLEKNVLWFKKETRYV